MVPPACPARQWSRPATDQDCLQGRDHRHDYLPGAPAVPADLKLTQTAVQVPYRDLMKETALQQWPIAVDHAGYSAECGRAALERITICCGRLTLSQGGGSSRGGSTVYPPRCRHFHQAQDAGRTPPSPSHSARM